MIFAFLQTCVALSAEPFTKKQYEEMVRLFNDHQQSNVKQPFDRSEELEVVFLASENEATGGFFFVDSTDGKVKTITTYTSPMKFAFYSMSIEGGKIGLTALAGGPCVSYWTYSVFPDKADYYVFVNECYGEVTEATSTTTDKLDPEIARITVKQFMMEHDPVGEWHKLRR